MRRTFAAAAVLAVGLALFAGRASGTAAPTFFDPTFANAGKALLAGSGAYWETGLVQSDGKPVAVGSDGSNLLLARYTTSGVLDPTFGSNGVSATSRTQAVGLTIVPDGDQFLVAGADGTSASSGVIVARYNSDGSLDTTFGTNGFFAGHLPADSNEAAYSIGVQSDGRIVVLVDHLENVTKQEWGLIGLNADGSLNTAFGSNGYWSIQTGGTSGGTTSYLNAYSLLVEPNDEILVAGEDLHRMSLWEFTASGSLDTSFGTNGWALGWPASSTYDVALSIVRQSDGSIVLGGTRGLVPGSNSSDAQFLLERFKASGQLDAAFGIPTTQLGPADDVIEGLAQAPDGDLVAVGFSRALDSSDGTAWHDRFAAVRYHANGTLDTAFGQNGIAVTPGIGIWGGAAVMQDGRFYAFGYDGNTAVLARYLAGVPTLSMSTASGVVGDVVHLSGPDMSADDVVEIGKLTVPAPDVEGVSATQLDVTIPPGAVTGKISVATASGTATSATNFAVLPGVASLTGTGPFTTGQTLGITGTTFAGVTALKVGGVAWPFKVNSDTHITATVPAVAVSGDLTLSNIGGTTDAGSITIAPVVSAFSPAAAAANAPVTITGSGLAGVAVDFNGVAATVKTSSATHLVVLVPPTATIGSITVTSADTLTSSTLTSFKPLPVITSVTQGREGDQVTITGTNLAAPTSLLLGTLPAAFTPVDALSLTARVPAAGNGEWTLTTPAGRVASKLWFAAPTITSFDPGSGPIGVKVTLHGLDFTGATKVLFGTTKALFKVVSATQLTANVPVGASTGRISITNAGGTTASVGSFSVG